MEYLSHFEKGGYHYIIISANEQELEETESVMARSIRKVIEDATNEVNLNFYIISALCGLNKDNYCYLNRNATIIVKCVIFGMSPLASAANLTERMSAIEKAKKSLSVT